MMKSRYTTTVPPLLYRGSRVGSLEDLAAGTTKVSFDGFARYHPHVRSLGNHSPSSPPILFAVLRVVRMFLLTSSSGPLSDERHSPLSLMRCYIAAI